MKQTRRHITASEVASFGYCPEAWRLEHGMKLPAANQPQRDAGILRHEKWKRADQGSSKLLKVTGTIAVIAFVWWLLSRL